jgi:dolichol-phosphate mannosyltransferase
MTLRSVIKKLKILEVPILFIERELGNSKMSQNIVLEALSFLMKNGIRRWLNLKIM